LRGAIVPLYNPATFCKHLFHVIHSICAAAVMVRPQAVFSSAGGQHWQAASQQSDGVHSV
jgi:hypothetical protein